ncbi:MAG: LysR substrate-binding domain-containing protein [Chloroflexota bacterium]
MWRGSSRLLIWFAKGKCILHFCKPDVACKEVELKEFMQDNILLIVPREHPWATREEIEPKELYEEVFILREEDAGTQVAVRSGLAKVGIEVDRLEKLLELGNSEAIAIAVQEGLGLGFVSEIVFERLVKNSVVPVRVRGLDLKRKIFIGRNRRRLATTVQTVFWDFIISKGDFSVYDWQQK